MRAKPILTLSFIASALALSGTAAALGLGKLTVVSALGQPLVAQIEFTEWTPDGHLRHSKFIGLREDKDAKDVVGEIEG